jgi:hypothetical protein
LSVKETPIPPEERLNSAKYLKEVINPVIPHFRVAGEKR